MTVDGESHHLVSHECEKAFDFQSVCVGCPVEGTEEAEGSFEKGFTFFFQNLLDG